MNCKPHELALIAIPEDCAWPDVREQINGMVVLTVQLDPLSPDHWHIAPSLTVIKQYPGKDTHGRYVPGGSVITLTGIPDRYLRPIRPDREAALANEPLEVLP